MLLFIINIILLSLSNGLRMEKRFSSSSSSSSSYNTINANMPPPDFNANIPPDIKTLFHLDFTSIKGPQLVGILAGCLVFTVTICVVFYLLYASGTLSRAAAEIKDSVNAYDGKKSNIPPQMSESPMLYDHLLEASLNLPLQIDIPELKGKTIQIKKLKHTDISEVNMIISICNGTAIYGESAYDPARIWGWIDHNNDTLDIYIEKNESNIIKECFMPYPSTSDKFFLSFYNENNAHYVLYDQIIKKPIGMFSLVDNNPKYLSIRISNIWLTPAYQNKKKGHESILLLLQDLFAKGYRRVTFEVNPKNVIMRKFLERCGFLLETIIRKHKIILGRNRDTCVYVVLNSEFVDIEIKLKKYLGLDIVPKRKKPADLKLQILPTLEDRDNELALLFNGTTLSNNKNKNDNKKKKSKNK